MKVLVIIHDGKAADHKTKLAITNCMAEGSIKPTTVEILEPTIEELVGNFINNKLKKSPKIAFKPSDKNLVFLSMEFDHLKDDPENIIAISLRVAKRSDEKLFRDVIQQLSDHKNNLDYDYVEFKTGLPKSLIKNIIQAYDSILKYV